MCRAAKAAVLNLTGKMIQHTEVGAAAGPAGPSCLAHKGKGVQPSLQGPGSSQISPLHGPQLVSQPPGLLL